MPVPTLQNNREPFPPSPSVLVPSKLSAARFHLPECAARIRALSYFRDASDGPVQPSLQSRQDNFHVCAKAGRVHFLFGSVQPLVSAPCTTAPARGLIAARHTCYRPRWAPLQDIVICGDLCDHLQCFTPPLTCCRPREFVGFISPEYTLVCQRTERSLARFMC